CYTSLAMAFDESCERGQADEWRLLHRLDLRESPGAHRALISVSIRDVHRSVRVLVDHRRVRCVLAVERHEAKAQACAKNHESDEQPEHRLPVHVQLT